MLTKKVGLCTIYNISFSINIYSLLEFIRKISTFSTMFNTYQNNLLSVKFVKKKIDTK